MRRRVLIALAVTLGALALAFGWASLDRCGEWPAPSSGLTLVATSAGSLEAGAARVALPLQFPQAVGGYGPLRSSAERAALPLFARALVLDVGGQRLALVALDVLLVSPQLRDRIADGLGVPVWVVATHTHSGPSGIDPRDAVELAALGRFDPARQAVVVEAARAAVKEALGALRPARLEAGERQLDGVSAPRSGAAVDRRLTRLRFDAAQGPVAQLLVLSAHPALVPRATDALHPDWPGVLAQGLEADGGPVTLVLQGAAGNASVERAGHPTAEELGQRLVTLVRETPTAVESEPLVAAWAEAKLTLPRPQATHVAPAPLRPVVENALCDEAEDVAVLHGLRLGGVRLLFLPFEPTLGAGLVLEDQAGVQRVVSLADGYAGYLETVETARVGDGEARRQYFPPELLTRVSEAARHFRAALGK